MGIRIHKNLGYGLTDVECDSEGQIVDSRFNLTSGYFALDVEDQEDINPKKFIEILGEKNEKARKEKDYGNDFIYELSLINDHLKKNKDPERFYNYIHFDYEDPNCSSILFQPYMCGKEWSRYDDPIDYCEYLTDYADGGISALAKLVNRPIYPYDSWTNLKDLSHCWKDDESGKLISWGQIRQVVCSDSLWKGDPMKKSDYVKQYGFSSSRDFLNNVVPSVPNILVEMCKFLKVFKDDRTIHTLKPMIYVHWS